MSKLIYTGDNDTCLMLAIETKLACKMCHYFPVNEQQIKIYLLKYPKIHNISISIASKTKSTEH